MAIIPSRVIEALLISPDKDVQNPFQKDQVENRGLGVDGWLSLGSYESLDSVLLCCGGHNSSYAQNVCVLLSKTKSCNRLGTQAFPVPHLTPNNVYLQFVKDN